MSDARGNVAEDLTGQVFGRLTVMARSQNKGKKVCWECRCSCGTGITVRADHLKRGAVLSCGCFRAEWVAENLVKHGQYGSRTYQAWQNMRARVLPEHPEAYLYFARGITVCPQWHDFEVFFADMGEAPAGLTLDRRENSKGYSKDNCRWATPKEQANNRRTNVVITAFEQARPLQAWALDSGLKPGTICNRLYRYGWTPEQAVSLPLQSRPLCAI